MLVRHGLADDTEERASGARRHGGIWLRVALLALALAGLTALGLHELLLRLIAGSGSEAVGVALGPGTPVGDLALMGSFVLVRVCIYLLGPGLMAAWIVLALPRRDRPVR